MIKKLLVTGSAGFIGHHLVMALQGKNYHVVGLDAINTYYDVDLKYHRLLQQGLCKDSIRYGELVHSSTDDLSFIQLDLTDESALEQLFRVQKFDAVVHLAAQAGVRHSLEHPELYVASNLVGFANILENCRRNTIKHLLFASSSSVYGHSQESPFKTPQNTDSPVSFYAATKKANEVMAYSYAHLYHMPITGMRFFTVYGPMGRPDMAYYSFANAIMQGTPISIFNNGDMLRDFTYIDDVIACILKMITVLPQEKNKASGAPFKIHNIGNSRPEQLLDLIAVLERLLNKKAILELQPMQPGDVQHTFADVDELVATIGFRPDTSLETGLGRFVTWYMQYHQQHQAQV